MVLKIKSKKPVFIHSQVALGSCNYQTKILPNIYLQCIHCCEGESTNTLTITNWVFFAAHGILVYLSWVTRMAGRGISPPGCIPVPFWNMYLTKASASLVCLCSLNLRNRMKLSVLEGIHDAEEDVWPVKKENLSGQLKHDLLSHLHTSGLHSISEERCDVSECEARKSSWRVPDGNGSYVNKYHSNLT